MLASMYVHISVISALNSLKYYTPPLIPIRNEIWQILLFFIYFYSVQSDSKISPSNLSFYFTLLKKIFFVNKENQTHDIVVLTLHTNQLN